MKPYTIDFDRTVTVQAKTDEEAAAIAARVDAAIDEALEGVTVSDLEGATVCNRGTRGARVFERWVEARA